MGSVGHGRIVERRPSATGRQGGNQTEWNQTEWTTDWKPEWKARDIVDREAQSRQEMRNQLGIELDRLQRAIDQFRVDAQRFFVGDLKIPPETLKDNIANDLRRLRPLASKGGTAGSYRLSSLEARFNSQVDLYERRMREQEEGARRTAEVPAEADPTRDGVRVGRGGADNAVETLYKSLYMRDGKPSPKMDLEKFRSYIHQQTRSIQEKTGASGVSFRIAVEDGKKKLKARPIKK